MGRHRVSCTGTQIYENILFNFLFSLFVVSLILHIFDSQMNIIWLNFLFISSFPFFSPSLCLSCFQHTIVSILVDVSQGCYRRAEAPEGVCASEGNRFGESERGHLQVQVHPPHLSGFALHLSLHVEGRSNQHIVGPGDISCSFNAMKDRREHVSIVTRTFCTYPSPFRSVTATE